MKKKLLITLAVACLLCSCGNAEEKTSETTTTSATTTTVTTTVATATTAETTTTSSANDMVFADPLPEEVTYGNYSEFISDMTNEMGDNYYIPDFSAENYDVVDVTYEVNRKNFDIHLKDDKENHIHYNSRANETPTDYGGVEAYYNNMIESNYLELDYVLREDLNGIFCEYFDYPESYFFVGFSENGHFYEFLYSGNNTDSSIEDVEQAMKDFGLFN